MGNGMKAIQISAPRLVELIDRPPVDPKQSEAILKLHYGGICGSDLGSYRGTFAYFSYPRIPGHEFSAEIVEIGSNDKGLKPGMLVTANPYFNCGRCYACSKGLVNACMDNQTMGSQRQGAFAEFITMPIGRIHDGKGLDAKTLALIEPFCIASHGIQQAHPDAHDRVLVIGTGTIGLMAAMAARMEGCEVVVSDISPNKLALAGQFGFDQGILNDDKEHFAEQVNQYTQGAGFDIVIEAVGLPSTFLAAVDSAAHGGRVIQIGVGKEHADFNFTLIQKKELHVIGSRNALDRDFAYVISMAKQGKINLKGLISSVYPYEQASEAFAEFDRNAGSILKILLSFS